jgi:hypothetical protein
MRNSPTGEVLYQKADDYNKYIRIRRASEIRDEDGKRVFGLFEPDKYDAGKHATIYIDIDYIKKVGGNFPTGVLAHEFGHGHQYITEPGQYFAYPKDQTEAYANGYQKDVIKELKLLFPWEK